MIKLNVYDLAKSIAKTITLTNTTTVETLKDIIQIELDIPIKEQLVSFRGSELINDSMTIHNCNIKSDDLITVDRKKPIVNNNTVPPVLSESAADQKWIEEQIRRKNINDNLEIAYEHSPEAFGSIFMLFINCKINGQPVKAFVDTGAQVTIMNTKCAERCGLLRLLDTRFQGIAMGVGQAKIFGRIHMAQMQIGSNYFGITLSVMDTPGPDVILGLDQLRKHQAHIDLENNVLKLGKFVVPFMHERDIRNDFPQHEKPKSLNSSDVSNSSPQQENPVSTLIKMGFSHAQAVNALRETGGMIEEALIYLLK